MSVPPAGDGLVMIAPSLRAIEIDPRAPDPSIEVQLAGLTIGTDVERAGPDMRDDGTGYVLWNLRVPFTVEMCCYLCRESKIIARIRDASGKRFEGQVSVWLERAECPDLLACCATADACPDPMLTQVCR